MINVDVLSKVLDSLSCRRALCGVLIVVVTAGLAACGNRDNKAGQTLVRVNGVDITVLQLNYELQHANVPAGKQGAVSKELLESLINRQLLVKEAAFKKIDRTPEVMLAIQRAKSQIIAKAYLHSVTSGVVKPSKAEINDYFQKHPEFFSKRKEFFLTQLVIPEKNLSAELKLFIKSAKTIEEVAGWMDKHGVEYARGPAVRSSMDLPSAVVTRLLKLPKGQLFIIHEDDNQVLSVVGSIKDSPVTESTAAPLIEQFLLNKRLKHAEEAEIAQLRSRAKIEYLNPSAPATQLHATIPDNNTIDPKD